MKLKTPKSSKEWADLWVKINRKEISFTSNDAACGAMELCEKFCTGNERHEASKERNKLFR